MGIIYGFSAVGDDDHFCDGHEGPESSSVTRYQLVGLLPQLWPMVSKAFTMGMSHHPTPSLSLRRASPCLNIIVFIWSPSFNEITPGSTFNIF